MISTAYNHRTPGVLEAIVQSNRTVLRIEQLMRDLKGFGMLIDEPEVLGFVFEALDQLHHIRFEALETKDRIAEVI